MLYGEEHPETGLKHKVKRCAFGSNLEVQNPITGILEKKPFKQFMIEQLVVAFERDRIVLSPWDEVLHKQLISYEVIKQNKVKGTVSYTDVDEHFVDCLAMCHLAFVMEFPEIGNIIREKELSSHISFKNKQMGNITKMLHDLDSNPWDDNRQEMGYMKKDNDDSPDKQKHIEIYSGSYIGSTRGLNRSRSNRSWGSRTSGITGRSFSRGTW